MHMGSAGSSAAAEASPIEGPSDRALRQYELQNMQGIEDTSILEDLAEAEEGYDKPDQVESFASFDKSPMCRPQRQLPYIICHFTAHTLL